MPVAVIREVAIENLRYRGGLRYVKGEKEPFNGKEITPRHDGTKWIEMPYVNGKRHGTKIWYEDDGRIWSETPYVEGIRQGVAIKYYKDGTRKSEEPWANGIRVGSGIEYREDGSIEKEVEYADNMRSEIWYREDGSIVKESWEDGKKVSLILLQPKQDSEAKKTLPPSTTKDAPEVTIGD